MTTSSNLVTGVVIRNQPKDECIAHIAKLIHRLSKLYQMKDWTEENSVLLAEWTYENYKYEEIQIVTRVLNNPPQTDGKSWRLTPDTIREWMTIELEKVAERREQIHNEKKNTQLPVTIGMVKDKIDKLKKLYDESGDQKEKDMYKKQISELCIGVDYESYKKRLEEGWLDRSDKGHDEGYEKFKTDYLMSKTKTNNTTPNT